MNPHRPAQSSTAETSQDGRWARRRLLAAAGPAAIVGAVGAITAGSRADAAVVSSPRFLTPTTLAELRAAGSGRSGSTYYLTDPGREGVFALVEGDQESADNGGTMVVSATGARFARVADTDVVDVAWFGAVGDGATDDTAAIRAAIAEAASRLAAISGRARPLLRFPISSGFRVTDTIVVPKAINIVMESELVYDGPADRPALDVGNAGGSNGETVMRLSVVVRKDAPAYAAWSTEESVGIRLKNLQESVVYVERVMGFTVGLQALADGAGFSYNEVHLGYFVDNQVSVDLTNRNSGWCNENLFFNGRITDQHSTAAIQGKGRVGIRITSMDGSYPRNNNNYFLKPSIELKAEDGGSEETLPILIERGQYNQFEAIRNESGAPLLARVLNDAADNTIRAGFGLAAIDDQSVTPTTDAHSARANLLDFPAAIFNSGSLVDNACYYDGASAVHIPGIGFATSAGAQVLPHGVATLAADHIECAGNASSALTVTVDTEVGKRFVLKRDCEIGHYGRIYLLCLDADGNIMTDSGGDAWVKTKRGQEVSPMATLFGGAYRTARDSMPFNGTEDFYFWVASEVSAVRVILWHGDDSLRIRSFSLYALDEGSAAVSAGVGRPSDERIAVAPPSAGAWPRGLLLRNAEPALSGDPGAQYVVTGWQKVTDAPTNELGVDWAELRSSTGG